MAKKSLQKRYFVSIKNTFDFSKTEQRGIVVLCVILLLLIGFYLCMSRFYQTEKEVCLLTGNPEIDSFLQQQQRYSDSVFASRKTYSLENNYEKKGRQVFTPFHFCPDTMKINDWQGLGFSEKQASQIAKFQSKGGKFFKKEDLQKMYCVSAETYSILEPYIHIASAAEKKYEKQEYPNSTEKYTYKLELNEADSADLLLITGIGSTVASRIVSYRTRLGGFIHIDQLKEIKYIDEERFAKIEPYLYVNVANIQKINVNEADFVRLVKHPYIDEYLAKTIVNQRNKTGKYASLEEMKKKLLIPDELYKKIVPYLTAE